MMIPCRTDKDRARRCGGFPIPGPAARRCLPRPSSASLSHPQQTTVGPGPICLEKPARGEKNYGGKPGWRAVQGGPSARSSTVAGSLARRSRGQGLPGRTRRCQPLTSVPTGRLATGARSACRGWPRTWPWPGAWPSGWPGRQRMPGVASGRHRRPPRASLQRPGQRATTANLPSQTPFPHNRAVAPPAQLATVEKKCPVSPAGRRGPGAAGSGRGTWRGRRR
jgi:hypothetical protein